MSDTVYRLLGPSHNRLLTVVDAAHTYPLKATGQISAAAAEFLMKHGWTPYRGPAKAKAGWVVPGTDPNLRPRTSFKVDL